MPKIMVNDKEIICAEGENLYKAMIKSNINIDAPCGGNGTCGKCTVFIDGIGIVKSCEYFVKGNITVNTNIARVEIMDNGFLREVNITDRKLCIAIDIGTTTVVAYFIEDGRIIKTKSGINAQKPFGDDVITRIKYSNENGTEKLSDLINEQINDMLGDFKNNDIAIVGNTTMLHVLANVSPKTIGVAPFSPVFTDFKKLGNITMLPSVSGYVGADTLSAILASGMHLSEKKALLIDIGTNGEIALGSRDGIITCATAAGPAFEGAHIEYGVGGIAGAIKSVSIGDIVTFETIDNKPPVGICGSGILDSVAQMLKAEIIDETGALDEDFEISDGIYITAKDVREVQLAKAAIAAGIYTLLRETDTDIEDIDVCFLAGGFGSYLNKQSACDIGLIPKELLNKIKVIGNAAGVGAVLWQISEDCRAELEEIHRITKYKELSGSVVFNNFFVDCMLFE